VEASNPLPCSVCCDFQTSVLRYCVSYATRWMIRDTLNSSNKKPIRRKILNISVRWYPSEIVSFDHMCPWEPIAALCLTLATAYHKMACCHPDKFSLNILSLMAPAVKFLAAFQIL